MNASVGGSEGANGVYNKLNKTFSGCLEEERRSAERAVISQVRIRKNAMSKLARLKRGHYPGLPLFCFTELWLF